MSSTSRFGLHGIRHMDILQWVQWRPPAWLWGWSTWCTRQGWERWVSSAWRRAADLTALYSCLEKMEPDSSWRSTVKWRQQTNWNMRSSDYIKGIFFLFFPFKHRYDHTLWQADPERLWNLHPWRHSKFDWQGHKQCDLTVSKQSWPKWPPFPT